jgi:Tat protein secretion system quality control protein TatD with DNase activity
MTPLTVYDSHCHLGVDCDFETIEKLAQKLEELPPVQHQFHIMTTYYGDIDLLEHLLTVLQDPSVVVPYYGVHPWYSHLYSVENVDVSTDGDSEIEVKRRHYSKIMYPTPTVEFLQVLPLPINIHEQLDRYRNMISKFNTKLNTKFGIGEIGLDKLFRVPNNGFYGNKKVSNDTDTKLSPYRVSIDHQMDIFKVQLQFAHELNKQVSIHCVKAHGALYDIVPQYPDISAVILHSFSGSIDQARLWINKFHGNLYFSFSNWINGTDTKAGFLSSVVSQLKDEQILIETDLLVDHLMLKDPHGYWEHLLQIRSKVSKVKNWDQAHSNILTHNMARSIA